MTFLRDAPDELPHAAADVRLAELLTSLGAGPHFANIFQSCPVALSIATASEGRFIDVNERWSDLFGYSRAEAIGRTPGELNIPVGSGKCDVLLRRLKTEGSVRDFELPVRPKSGDVRDTLMSGVLIDLLGHRDMWIASIVDVTDRTRIRKITDAALAYLSLDDLLRELLARLREALNAEIASVRLVDRRRHDLFVRAVDGVAIERVAGLRIPLDGLDLARPFLDNALQPPAVDDNTWFGEAWRALDLPLRAWMGVPLVVEGNTIGIVVVAATHSRFTESELLLLQMVADRVAPAIERARLAESLHESEGRLRSVSRRLLTAEETARRRIAVQLHDDLGQILTAAKITLDTARHQGMTPGAIADALACLDEATQRVRDLALDLRPAVLDDLGLSAALRWYVDRWQREAGLAVNLSIDAVPPLNTTLETVCFRLAQEALTNVARHARATHLWFDLHALGETLELSIRDDGVGFDPEAARTRAMHGASLGLLGMEERATLVGGEIEIVSAPGAGTSLRVRFALDDRDSRP